MVGYQQLVEEDVQEEPALGMKVDLALRASARKGGSSLAIAKSRQQALYPASLLEIAHEVQVGKLLFAWPQSAKSSSQVYIVEGVQPDGHTAEDAQGQALVFSLPDDPFRFVKEDLGGDHASPLFWHLRGSRFLLGHLAPPPRNPFYHQLAGFVKWG